VLAYCTISTDAVLVIAGIPPIDLQALQRKVLYDNRFGPEIGKVSRESESMLNRTWQGRWDSDEAKIRWTHKIIRNISLWRSRRHGHTDYWLTQALTNHGCFSHYLHKIGKLGSPECWYCGHHNDEASHTIFECDARETRRFRVETEIGGRL